MDKTEIDTDLGFALAILGEWEIIHFEDYLIVRSLFEKDSLLTTSIPKLRAMFERYVIGSFFVEEIFRQQGWSDADRYHCTLVGMTDMGEKYFDRKDMWYFVTEFKLKKVPVE